MARRRVELLIIDGQNGFVQESLNELYVPGSEKDADRLATLIRRGLDRWDDIHVTMDSHHQLHIANPLMWVDKNGHHPMPFTQIEAQAVKDGFWRINSPSEADQRRGLEYVETLEKEGRYVLTIWNPHCLIMTPGHNIYGAIAEPLMEWEAKYAAVVDKVTKGSNIWTEHYSAVKACIEDPEDGGTAINIPLTESLSRSDLILISGWATNFCVAETLFDISDYFDDGDPNYTNTKKMVLLEDCCSAIPDQPGETFMQAKQDHFMNTMISRGMQVAKSTDTNII